MTTDERAAAISEAVMVDLIDQLHDLNKHGRAYVRAYVETIVGPRTTRRPVYKFHPKLAELVRELANDAATFERCGTASLTVNRGDGRRAAGSSLRTSA